MSPGDAWGMLGIEPTGDSRAIRAAYSARLKTFDPEVDPKAFIALRDAFEAAKNSSVGRRDSAATAAPAPASADPAEANARSLSALLHARDDEDEPWLSASERAEALKHWHAVVEDPRMAEIGFFADVERWAGELIAATAPRPIALIHPACQVFGWTRSNGSVVQRAAVAEVVRRHGVLRFLDEAQQPGHSHHRAWVELTTPTTPRMNRGRVDRRKINELLGRVREVAPEMEDRFDRLRVGLWVSPPGPMPRRMIVWLAIGGWVAVVSLLYAIGAIW